MSITKLDLDKDYSRLISETRENFMMLEEEFHDYILVQFPLPVSENDFEKYFAFSQHFILAFVTYQLSRMNANTKKTRTNYLELIDSLIGNLQNVKQFWHSVGDK